MCTKSQCNAEVWSETSNKINVGIREHRASGKQIASLLSVLVSWAAQHTMCACLDCMHACMQMLMIIKV